MIFRFPVTNCFISIQNIGRSIPLRKHANNLIIYPHKSTFAKFKADFFRNIKNF